jgi:hypothetical protein
VGKYEGKRLLGGSGLRREDNNKMGFQEVKFGVTNWIDLSHNRDRWWALLNVVMNFRVP